MHNSFIKETMEDNGCIFTPIRQTLAQQLLQVLEEMSSCTLKNFLVNLIFEYCWIWYFNLIRNLKCYLKGRNFRGKKLSRFRKTAKYLHFAGINFRGWRLTKNFAGLNFRGEPLSKDFMGIKTGENLNLWEEKFVFIVLC